MKKLLAILFSVVFIFTLSACEANDPAISADEALNIALQQAGVARDNITNLENKLDRDDGVLVYEIDFDAGNTEYSFDVNAQTGTVTERDKERID